MTDNLFAGNSAPATPEVTAPVADPLLASITDETGKPKYASVEAALKALANAQAHIKTIETENAQLREVTTKAKTMEEILQAIKPSEAAPAAPAAPAPKQPEDVDIATIVTQTVLGLKAKEAEEANIQTVVEKVKKVYGDAASETFYTKAAELGFDKEGINSLSRKNPAAVLKLLGIEADKTPTKTPQGTIRTDAFTSTTPAQPTKSGMAHGDTQHLVDAWRRSAEKVNQKLGINK